ncbi:MAG: bifunctional [glutamine synthetase] adenylyltransferase/[glutamine synthetase]-adenylyl-L-tyrosine phosphorylase [Actinomycetota bacterium]|nr:bifunctional [glutamine synthetase] adenylyltransferase/[glutamine synthetase]-adenylyl-L-tyrosine phosphorylase [Actinomycetota bacterium]
MTSGHLPIVVADLISVSAQPGRVASALAQLAEAAPTMWERMGSQPSLGATVVTVMAASPAMTRLILRRPGSVDVLARLPERPLPPPSDLSSLRVWAELEMLRTVARDLMGLDRLETVGRHLAELAAEVLRVALERHGIVESCVIGMGKLGGSELNYSSDIDVLLVGPPSEEPALRQALAVVRDVFRVDLDLRPEGRSGPMVRTVDSYRAYWERWAEPWEFQALLKARYVAGSAATGKAFCDGAAEALWSMSWGTDELRSIRHMKARTEAETARRGLAERELKRGAGGIRDVEFAVQVLQLVHGGDDPSLRVAGTLDALSALARFGYVAPSDAAALVGGYRFLRTVEHRLQLEEMRQVHTVPAAPAARERLARVLGYTDDVHHSAVERFDSELRRTQAEVRAIHERLWFRPLLDAFSQVSTRRLPLRPTGGAAFHAASERLAAFGFANAARTRDALVELTAGLTRSSRLMQQMLPLLLWWLSDSPDPDLGLLGLRKLARGQHRDDRLVELCRDSPEAARRLCLLLGTGKIMADTFSSDPDLLAEVGDVSKLRRRSRQEIVASTAPSLAVRSALAERGTVLRRARRREQVRLAVMDLLGMLPLEDVSGGLAQLAEATLEMALDAIPPPVPLAVVAMGRLGGTELSFASDIDLVLVARPSRQGDMAEAEAHAKELSRFLRGPVPAEEVVPVDLSLRPEGRQGPLVRSFEAYVGYFDRWAQTWERQAYLRARPVAGDPELGSSFSSAVSEFVWSRPLEQGAVREVRRMKARMERERIPVGQDPEFHLKLGRGSLSDVEWTVQLLQLQYGVREARTLVALGELVRRGHLTAEEGEALADAYRFCEHTRNRVFLTLGRRSDSLPTRPEDLARLARSLDRTPTHLREEYRRVTRRARRVTEARFYGEQGAGGGTARGS